MSTKRTIRHSLFGSKILLLILLSPLAITLSSKVAFGQTQLINGGFEEWTLTKGSGLFKDYEEPSHGWSSGNGVIHVAPNTNPVVEKSTDAAVGNYAAKLITQSIFNQIAAGSLFIGRFKMNFADFAASAIIGAPFADRPTRLKGQIKYSPVNGDSATLYARLTKWTGSAQVVIGEAVVTEYNAVPNWKAFSIPFVYFSESKPDSIRVVFASSAGGENFKGEAGSTLLVDAIELDYTPLSVTADPTPGASTVLRNLGTAIEYSVPNNSTYRLYIINACGTVVREAHVDTALGLAECSTLPQGVYLARVVGSRSEESASLLFSIVK